MKTPAQVREDVWEWVAAGSSLADSKIVFADPNAPRPSLPYITLRLSSSLKLGHSFKSPTVPDTGVGSATYDVDIALSIQSFGEDSDFYLEELRRFIDTESGKEEAQNRDIVVRDENGPITDISLLIDETIEKRYLYEMFLGYAQEITDNVGYIENVDLTQTVDPPC